ncbi:MAG: hypothetical protein R3Y39_04355 [Rikenellaceae bacterium]
MRQETGSNQFQNIISISVRLQSSGDPFLIADHIPPSAHESDAFLRVELLTKRAALVPRSVLEQSSAERELAAMGIMVDGGDDEVLMVEDRDLISLLVVPRGVKSYMESNFSGRYEFKTPLLHRPVCADAHMLLDVCEGLTTIKVYEKGWRLQFVDIYETPSIASAVYWAQRLSSVLNLGRSSLYIYRCSGALDRLLGSNFKKILYANNKRSV